LMLPPIMLELNCLFVYRGKPHIYSHRNVPCCDGMVGETNLGFLLFSFPLTVLASPPCEDTVRMSYLRS
jgi:hypothetical protein